MSLAFAVKLNKLKTEVTLVDPAEILRTKEKLKKHLVSNCTLIDLVCHGGAFLCTLLFIFGYSDLWRCVWLHVQKEWKRRKRAVLMLISLPSLHFAFTHVSSLCWLYFIRWTLGMCRIAPVHGHDWLGSWRIRQNSQGIAGACVRVFVTVTVCCD